MERNRRPGGDERRLQRRAQPFTMLVAVVAVIITVGTGVAIGLLIQINRVEEVAARESAERLFRGLMAAEARHLGMHVRDYTNWDEAIEHLPGRYDAAWFEENAGAYAVGSFGLSFSLAADGQGVARLVATAGGDTLDPAKMMTPSLAAMLAAARASPVVVRNPPTATTGLILFDGRPHLAAAARYVQENEDSPANPDPAAVLVYARALSDVIAGLSRVLEAADIRVAEQPSTGDAAVPLVTADGGHVGFAVWHPHHPGRSTETILPAVYWAFASMALLAALFLLRIRALAGQMHDDKVAYRELALRTQSILDAAGEGIFGLGPDGQVAFANPSALAALGYTAEEFMGRDPHPLIHWGRADDIPCPPEACPMRAVLADGKARSVDEDVFVRKGGIRFPVEYLVTPLTENERVVGAVVVFRDISGRKRTEQEIRYRANYDSLTGLPNRSLLGERLEQAIKRARRNRTNVAVMFIDLDRFKHVNDTLGHQAGDRLLIEAGERLRHCVRETDTVARQGGDEFVVILSDIHGEHDAALVADNILTAMSGKFVVLGQDAYVGASIGISLFPADGEDVNALLRNADLAMYRAKEAGRNDFQFYKLFMTESILQRRDMEVDLRRAVEKGELTLHYQPIIQLATGMVTELEALLRWKHPQRGLVLPADFIPLAEETGLITLLGEWVLAEACRQIAEWHKAGRAMRVAINVSSRQVPRGLSVDRVKAVLEDHAVPAMALCFEITEAVLLDNTARVHEWLLGLRGLGVGVVIDDFGTGYSSLGYLKRFPVEAVKIDRSFIDGAVDNASDSALVAAIIAMSHGLGIAAVAEGVERNDQRAWLQGQGCDQIQGFLLGRPVPAGECPHQDWWTSTGSTFMPTASSPADT